MSAYLGHLMPHQSYRYIPMVALNNLEIQIRLNPYAFFTSGYKNAATADTYLTASDMLSRTWRVNQIILYTDLIMFDEQTKRAVYDQLNSDRGIILHSVDWMLGPMYPIPSN